MFSQEAIQLEKFVEQQVAEHSQFPTQMRHAKVH